MDKIEPLVIITDGFSGLIAAQEAAAFGMPSIVLDSSPSPSGFPLSCFTQDEVPLIRVAKHVNVLGIFEGREILWSQGDTSGTFRADQILLDTGVINRHMPFPGWDLPSVISHDELASRLWNGDTLTAKRAIVAGGGDGLAYSAQGLVCSDVEVVAILDVG